MEIRFDDIASALRDFAVGKPLVVVDDQSRENEGDIILPAQHATPEWIHFCAQEARGLICIAISTSIAERLQLKRLRSNRKDLLQTAFLDPIDANQSYGVTTGISAFDRSITAKLVTDPNSTVSDFIVPGHLFPLQAVPGGVIQRQGHTEAAVDLCRLTNQPEAGIICEILAPDGTMMRRDALRAFADSHQLKMITIEDLRAYRYQQEQICTMVAESLIPTAYGEFQMKVFRNMITGVEHTVLGQNHKQENKPLVRLHSECHTGDIFGSQRCDCRDQLQGAMKAIAENGHGWLIYLKGHEGRGIGLVNKLKAYALQDQGLDTYAANVELGFAPDQREYLEGIQILKQVCSEEFVLLTNNPTKVEAIRSAGLSFSVTAHPAAPNEHNQRYLWEKQKLGKHANNILI
jgi:3,4-dihydroxy 2-butanone 4-phosphate synthase/GTP cyclohydrolase II